MGLRFEQEVSGVRPRSWALTLLRRSRLDLGIYRGVSRRGAVDDVGDACRLDSTAQCRWRPNARTGSGSAQSWRLLLVALWHVLHVIFVNTTLQEAGEGVRACPA